MINSFPMKSTQPEVWEHHIRLLGTGAAVPTVEEGSGFTMTRQGTGAYTVTWSENPGVFVNVQHTFGAATPGDLAGHTLVRDTYSASTYALPLIMYNASDAAHDLAANEYLDLVVSFKRTSV